MFVLLQFLWFDSRATSQIMCAFFSCFCKFWLIYFFLFPGGWCHTKWSAEGNGKWKWSTMQIRDFSVYKVSDILPEEYIKQGENTTLDLLLQYDDSSVLCVSSSTWLVKKKKKKCLPSDLFFFLFLPPVWIHFCISIQLLDSFSFEHDRNALPFYWKLSAFQTVVIVWHSVVGGHVMVCVAQPLGLLVRTYKIVFIWARTFLLTIKQPSSYKTCRLLRNLLKKLQAVVHISVIILFRLHVITNRFYRAL